MTHTKRAKQRGFTLVELSIVLVIIGLIVGGVLVGQDLVKAAQIRAVVTQLQQYDAAVNTFRGKFDGLPGDLSRAEAFLGVAADAANSFTGNGNGNGRLDDAAETATPNTNTLADAFDDELLAFWHHLSVANMVPGTYTPDDTAADADVAFPSTKLKKGSIVAVSENASLFWVVGGSADMDTDFATGAGIAGTGADNLTPLEAYGIDNKIDDGFANTGIAVHVTTHDNDVFTRVGTTAADATAGSETCWATTPATATTPVDFQLAVDVNNCTLITRVQS